MRPMMMLPLLAVLLSSAAPVRADEAATKDLQTLRTCLTTAKANERSCLGKVADPCQNEPDGGSTPGTAACFNREEAAWDAVLNERYAAAVALAKETEERLRGPDALPGASPSPVLDPLRKAQRAWIAFRDAECERVYALNQEGTIRTIAASVCGRDLTAERAIGLAPENQ